MEFHASEVDTVQRRLAIPTEAAHIGLWDWNLLTGEMLYSRLAKTICGFSEDGAVKYGALFVPGGQVRLVWAIQSGDRFELTWQEDGGPVVVRPTQTGFGTRMIERALFVPFEGHATINYDPSGVRCRVVATLPERRH